MGAGASADAIPGKRRHARDDGGQVAGRPSDAEIDDGSVSAIGDCVPGKGKSRGPVPDQVPGSTAGLGFGSVKNSTPGQTDARLAFGSDAVNDDDAVPGRSGVTGSDTLEDGIRHMSSVRQETSFCEICSHGYIQSDGFCQDCKHNLCRQCIAHHKKIKATEGHIIHLKPGLTALGTDEIIETQSKENEVKENKTSKPELLLRCKISFRTAEESGSNCQISGIAVLPGGHVVITDCWTNAVKLVDMRSEVVLSRMGLSESPEDIAVVSDTLVAVTVPQRKEIQLCGIHDNTLSVGEKLKVNGMCNSIAFDSNNFVVSYNQMQSIDVISIDGKLVRSFSFKAPGASSTGPWYLAANRDAIYVSDRPANKVFKLSWQGDFLCEYEDDELIGPVKLNVKEDGELFICSRGTDSIHLVSNSMRKVGLLEPEATLNNPCAVAYDENGQLLIVGMNPNGMQDVRETLHIFELLR